MKGWVVTVNNEVVEMKWAINAAQVVKLATALCHDGERVCWDSKVAEDVWQKQVDRNGYCDYCGALAAQLVARMEGAL